MVPVSFRARGNEVEEKRARGGRGGGGREERGGSTSSLSPSPSPSPTSPSSLRAFLKRFTGVSPETNKPVSQDAEVRSFVYALLSLFFFSFFRGALSLFLLLVLTLLCCRRLKKKKKRNRIIIPMSLCSTSSRALAPRNPAVAVRRARAVAQR